MTTGRQHLLEAVAQAIGEACIDRTTPERDICDHSVRWQHYVNAASAVTVELQAAQAGEPGRSAVPHLASVIGRACDDAASACWYERAAGDAVRATMVR